jgi:SAM-dependent methyltransferase
MAPTRTVEPVVSEMREALRAGMIELEAGSAVAQPKDFQPTDTHLVWGRRQERADYRFRARSAVVEQLISRWSKPDWIAVDVSGGAGRWLATLAPRFRAFTHLDLSREALAAARADHPDLSHVEFGIVDLLRGPGPLLSGRTWDVAFCLDTLLYRGPFVETALRNIRPLIRPGGIAIIDLPLGFRASISRCVKGRRYGGPERTFSPGAARLLVREAGYTLLATAYQYRELSPRVHRGLAASGLTPWVPWPGTWMYLVLRSDV